MQKDFFVICKSNFAFLDRF